MNLVRAFGDVGEEGRELKAADVERDADLAQLLLQHRRQQARGLLRRSLHGDVKADAVHRRDSRRRREAGARAAGSCGYFATSPS